MNTYYLEIWGEEVIVSETWNNKSSQAFSVFKFGAQKMAQWLKHLPHKHEVQSLYPHILHKCPIGSADLPVIQCLKAETGLAEQAGSLD